MKFPELPPGARFRFEGRIYTKLGPLTARDEGDGRMRMIPRYARLEPVEQAGACPEPGAGPKTVPTPRLLAAFERFHAVCVELLGGGGPDAAARLAAARRRFFEDCGLNRE